MDGVREQFVDRRGWLIFFGAAEMLLGGVFLAAAAGLLAGGRPPGGPSDGFFPTAYFASFYLLLAAFFIAVGIGSAAARRWARSIMVTASWFWLITGTLSFIGTALLVPRALPEFFTPGSAEYGAVLGTVVTFAFLVLVAAPLVLVLFYSGRHVKATVARRHPEGCWTDRCPMPPFSLCLFMWFQGAVILLYALLPMPFLVFGGAVHGSWGTVLWIVFGLAMIYAGYRAYRVHGAGWLLSAGLVGFVFLSSLVTFLFGDMDSIYGAVGGESGGGMIDESIFRDLFLWVTGSMLLFTSCYFAWLRKFFPKALFKPGS